MRGIKQSGAAILAVAAAFGVANLPAQAEDGVVISQCEIVVDAEALPRSAEPLMVEATYSEPIGEELTVVIPEESGIRLVAVEPDAENGQVLHLTLDTSEAAPGEWELAVRSDAGQCTGTLVVAADEEDTDGR
jgi:hypothetical protein